MKTNQELAYELTDLTYQLDLICNYLDTTLTLAHKDSSNSSLAYALISMRGLNNVDEVLTQISKGISAVADQLLPDDEKEGN